MKMNQRLEITAVCVACDNCKIICPESAIVTNGKEYFIEDWSCTKCHLCIEVCPVDCIKLIDVKPQ